jgi:predicted methyltransferase
MRLGQTIRPFFAGTAIAVVLAVTSVAASADQALNDAVKGTWRTPANVQRDVWRKPVDALTFWGLKPGMAVLELSPGGGWWTEILAPYARMTKGTYAATAADLNNPELSQAARDARAQFEKKFSDQTIYGPITYVNFGLKSQGLGAPNSVDFVLNGRNIHNWMANGIMDKVMSESFAVLKSGGILAIEEHRNAPDAVQDPKAPTGYVTEAYVIAAAEKAGFKLAERSELYANAKDDRDHPFGVWTLPPARRTAPQGQPANPNFDSAPYDAIGESDRMALRFVKP